MELEIKPETHLRELPRTDDTDIDTDLSTCVFQLDDQNVLYKNINLTVFYYVSYLLL